jgi:hypothetical protein
MSKSLICLDFDGVLHSYISGWKAADVIIDPPFPGAMEFLLEAVRTFRVAVFSSRSGQPGGIAAMAAWIDKQMALETGRDQQGWAFNNLEFPESKPPALVTLDDRVIPFTGKWPSMIELKNFKPWYKK